MYLPRQPGNDRLIEWPVTHWCVVDGKTGPYEKDARLLPVIAAVRHVSSDRYLILGDEVPIEGLADRLRSMIDARYVEMGLIKP